MSTEKRNFPSALDRSVYFRKNVFVHTHIEKTGGTSFITGLVPILGEEHIYDMRGKLPPPSELSIEKKANIWLLTGHFYYDTEDRPIDREKRYFICVRDPVDRFISLYNYVARSPLHPGYRQYGVLDIESAYRWFSKHRPDGICNRISDMFGKRRNTPPGEPGKVARPNYLWRIPPLNRFASKPVTFETACAVMEQRFALVIPMNCLDVAVRRIGEIFGVHIDTVKRENVGVKKVTTVPEPIRREILERNALDMRLMEHFQSRFRRDVEDLPDRLMR